jgi:hypothetical protein
MMTQQWKRGKKMVDGERKVSGWIGRQELLS